MEPPRKPGFGYLWEPIAPAVIWIGYFMIVYLIAEAACAMAITTGEVLGLSGVGAATIVATIASIGAIGYYTVRSWRRFKGASGESALAHQDKSLGLIGVLSGFFFIVASVYVGVPALVMAPC